MVKSVAGIPRPARIFQISMLSVRILGNLQMVRVALSDRSWFTDSVQKYRNF